MEYKKCIECGREITVFEDYRNHGLCDRCNIEKILKEVHRNGED